MDAFGRGGAQACGDRVRPASGRRVVRAALVDARGRGRRCAAMRRWRAPTRCSRPAGSLGARRRCSTPRAANCGRRAPLTVASRWTCRWRRSRPAAHRPDLARGDENRARRERADAVLRGGRVRRCFNCACARAELRSPARGRHRRRHRNRARRRRRLRCGSCARASRLASGFPRIRRRAQPSARWCRTGRHASDRSCASRRSRRAAPSSMVAVATMTESKYPELPSRCWPAHSSLAGGAHEG